METRLVAAIEIARSAQPVIAGVQPSDEPDEEAGVEEQVAIPGVEVAVAPLVSPEGAGSPDEDGPVWPNEADESAMRVEVAERGETLNSKAARLAAEAAAEAAAEKKNLPKLDELIAKIPADVLELMEELLRAKFVKVLRVPKKALKE